MNLDIYNTHMELYPYIKGDYPIIEKQYTATDKFTGNEFPCGYMIEDGKLYLPRGTSISWIESLTGAVVNDKFDSDPVDEMNKKHYSLYDPRDKIQEEAISFLKEDHHQSALNLQTGLGKAQPNSTKIPTPNGYKLMGDLKVGDKVFGSNGKPITVTEIFPQETKLLVYKISFVDGRYALCCENHLWTIFDKKSNNWKTITTKMMIDKLNNGEDIFIQKLSSPVLYNEHNTFIDPYFVGNKISDMDEFFIPKMMEYELRKMYLYNSVYNRLLFLKGLMKNKVYHNNSNELLYTSKNHRLSYFIRELILSLGCFCKIDEDSDSYKITMILESPILDFITGATNEFIPIDDTSPKELLKVSNIEALYEDECTCIMVDSYDHLYVTEDFIITHNTFCVAYASTELMKKTMIITPNESLKMQWLKTYSTMFECKSKHLMNIAGSGIINGIMEDLIDYNDTDVFFVNHQTLQGYMANNNGYMLHKFFKKIGIGIKVYDESHMNFNNILTIDNFSNTDRTWYLTATFDRSDKTESKCFKRAFNSVITYGEMESKEVVKKHVIYHVVDINSRITPKNRASVIGYTGVTAISYGKYAFFNDPNDTAYKVILTLLEKTKNMEGKTLIFVPLIDAVDEVVKRLKKDFPEKSIAAYHSRVSKDEKESAVKKDIIVSTIKSCGTGKDIPGLRCLICLEPIASKVVAQQLIGRLRPYADDKDTYFFDVTDISITPLIWWRNSRIKKYQELAKKIIYLNIDK